VNKTKKRGWFRTADDEELNAVPAGSIDVAVPGPPLAAPPPPSDVAPMRADDRVDIGAILASASVSGEDRDRVDRARQLLRALPNGVSADVRRQIVEAALTTFGVPTERIVDAGHKVSDALQGFIAANRHATERLVEEARTRVHALEQEILRVRQAADQASAIHEKRIHDASVEVVAVRQVLEFFGANVADVDLEETTEDRTDWGVQLPIPPASRLKRDTTSKPPPTPPVEVTAGKQPPADPSKPQN
jgi:hypothetical protein